MLLVKEDNSMSYVCEIIIIVLFYYELQIFRMTYGTTKVINKLTTA